MMFFMIVGSVFTTIVGLLVVASVITHGIYWFVTGVNGGDSPLDKVISKFKRKT